jgi:hypothetical protein
MPDSHIPQVTIQSLVDEVGGRRTRYVKERRSLTSIVAFIR